MKTSFLFKCAIMICLSISLSSCSEDDSKLIGELPPVNATNSLYFFYGTSNLVDELKTSTVTAHDVDYFVGKDIINKGQYEMYVLIDNEPIVSSCANPYFDLIVRENSKNEKYIEVVGSFFYVEGIEEYDIVYKIKCPILFKNTDFHEIKITGKYSNQVSGEKMQRLPFVLTSAFYRDELKIENIAMGKYQLDRRIYIKL